MYENIYDFKQAVRGMVKAEGWSVSRLAQEAGLRVAAISDIHRPDWNPYSDTLQACLDVVDRHLLALGATRAGPTSNPIPLGHLRRESNLMFRQCIEIWHDEAKRYGPLLKHRLETVGALPRLSAVRVDVDNRMRMISYGSNAFGEDFDPEDKLLWEMPDHVLFSWIEGRLWRVLVTEEPEFSTCVAPTHTHIGVYDIPYTSLVLPCILNDAGIFDCVIAVSRLEPSQYRADIESRTLGQKAHMARSPAGRTEENDPD